MSTTNKEIILEDGPFSGDHCRISDEVWDSGYYLRSESRAMAEHGEGGFPRTGRYIRHEASWTWDGWV